MFLNNVWYIAAYSDEISANGAFPRKILGRSVIMYRTENGDPIAMLDRCPHRLVPCNYPPPTSDDQAEMAPSMVWKGLLPDRRAVSTVDRIAASASAAHLAR